MEWPSVYTIHQEEVTWALKELRFGWSDIKLKIGGEPSHVVARNQGDRPPNKWAPINVNPIHDWRHHYLFWHTTSLFMNEFACMVMDTLSHGLTLWFIHILLTTTTYSTWSSNAKASPPSSHHLFCIKSKAWGNIYICYGLILYFIKWKGPPHWAPLTSNHMHAIKASVSPMLHDFSFHEIIPTLILNQSFNAMQPWRGS